jgi:signal transduction histidine kinase
VRRFPIRTKLGIALVVPLVAMGLVTVIEVISVSTEARRVRDQTGLATATIGPNGLITALQNERNWASAQLVGVDQTLALEVSGYDETRAATDAAVAQFEAGLDHRGEAAQSAYTAALENLSELDQLRSDIDGYVATTTPSLDNIGLTTELFDQYTALIAQFFGGMSRISIAMDDPELREGARLMEAVSRQLETIPQMTNALVLPASVPTAEDDVAGLNRPAEIIEVAQLHNAFRRQADLLRSATGAYAEIAAEHFPEDFTRSLDEQTAQGLSTGQVDVPTLLASLDTPDSDLAYLNYRDGIATALQDRADELNASATSRQQRFALLMAVTFGAAVALTVLVSLSITRPLRSLTRQAKDMADRRLPDAVAEILDTPLGEDVTVPTVAPVKVATRDEVADVAAALNTVQDSALDLAVEQAVLRRNIADSFVNLGRRNQNLLGRQLDFITELESAEADPDNLASLFRLDHLATRMRRNAESLLVLAGIEPPRQWVAPVRLADVIRAALGEVEDYQRVTVRGVEPATIQGSAAADLAHLLAELIENALVYSPPDRTVDIRGVARSAHSPGGYTLAIVDAGLGMPPDDIEAANRRLAGGESFTIAPSKYLGHYVAGNLAARHDIGVHLRSSPGGGITATIELPASLLTEDSGQVAAAVDPRGPRGRALRPPAHSAPPAPVASARRPERALVPPLDTQLASLARAAGRVRTGEHPAVPTARSSASYSVYRPAGQAAAPPPAAAPPRAAAPPPAAAPPWAAAPPPAARGRRQAPPPLARRDRGTHMPTTAPLSVRRSPDPAPPGAASRPQTRSPRAADEVYGFLSKFTAGVQQGLEAVRTARGDLSGA